MVDISSQNNKINVTVSSSGNTANTNVTPDYAQYYSEKSKEWATSNRIVDNTDYSSKYYANESKKQADISTAKTTEVVESGNTAVSNIESARDNAIFDVNTAGATQVALATEQATIATNKASEVVASGNDALANIDTAKDNAITSITNQEITSKTSLIDEGATQVGLIQNEGATQVANVQSTGFYMRDDKLYFINSQGEETEFKSGGSGLEVCDIGMALYVDETKGLRRYLNGQIVDINTNTQAFLNRLKQITTLHPSLLCTEEEWQTAKTMSAFGQVGKFVFNYSGDDIVSVRLPRVVNVQGLFDLQNLGMTVGQALPSHTHTRGTMNITGALSASNIWAGTAGASGCFSVADNGYHNSGGNGGSGCNTYTWTLNASKNWTGSTSAPNYSGTVATGAVQQEAIQYPYFIQIATGQETENNITNEIELNTLSFFGDSKYVPTEVNNLSWLKSEGQNNPKGTYPSFYDWILENVNKGEEGFKLSTATDITDYDFVINTANETFRLPLRNGMESMFMKQAPVVGNGKTLGLTNGVQNFAMVIKDTGTASNQKFFNTDVYGSQVSQNSIGPNFSGVGSVGITTDPSNSGLVADLSNVTVPLGWNLYYYVGETVQNANLIDAGRIGEILPTKTDMQQAAKASMPSDRYVDLALGASGTTYTAPANGYFQLAVLEGNSIQFYNKTKASFWKASTSTGQAFAESIECQAGDVIQCYYSYTTFRWFRFYYAEGSK